MSRLTRSQAQELKQSGRKVTLVAVAMEPTRRVTVVKQSEKHSLAAAKPSVRKNAVGRQPGDDIVADILEGSDREQADDGDLQSLLTNDAGKKKASESECETSGASSEKSEGADELGSDSDLPSQVQQHKNKSTSNAVVKYSNTPTNSETRNEDASPERDEGTESRNSESEEVFEADTLGEDPEEDLQNQEQQEDEPEGMEAESVESEHTAEHWNSGNNSGWTQRGTSSGTSSDRNSDAEVDARKSGNDLYAEMHVVPRAKKNPTTFSRTERHIARRQKQLAKRASASSTPRSSTTATRLRSEMMKNNIARKKKHDGQKLGVVKQLQQQMEIINRNIDSQRSEFSSALVAMMGALTELQRANASSISKNVGEKAVEHMPTTTTSASSSSSSSLPSPFLSPDVQEKSASVSSTHATDLAQASASSRRVHVATEPEIRDSNPPSRPNNKTKSMPHVVDDESTQSDDFITPKRKLTVVKSSTSRKIPKKATAPSNTPMDDDDSDYSRMGGRVIKANAPKQLTESDLALIKSWLEQLDTFFRGKRYNYYTRAISLHNHVDLKLSDRFRQAAEEYNYNWKLIKQELIRRYQRDLPREDLEAQFGNLLQRVGEAVQDYYNRVTVEVFDRLDQARLNDGHHKILESEKTSRFTKGLHPELLKLCPDLKKYTSLTSALEKAREVERDRRDLDTRERKLKEQSSSSSSTKSKSTNAITSGSFSESSYSSFIDSHKEAPLNVMNDNRNTRRPPWARNRSRSRSRSASRRRDRRSRSRSRSRSRTTTARSHSLSPSRPARTESDFKKNHANNQKNRNRGDKGKNQNNAGNNKERSAMCEACGFSHVGGADICDMRHVCVNCGLRGHKERFCKDRSQLPRNAEIFKKLKLETVPALSQERRDEIRARRNERWKSRRQ